MLFASAVLAFLAGSALATPVTTIKQVAGASRMGVPMQKAPGPLRPASQTGNTSFTSYSSNWAGAVYDFTSPNTFQSATGTFVVPVPRTPAGDSGTYSAAAWVGIDGDTCGSAILQAGITMSVNGGSTWYSAWFEWFPAPESGFDNFEINGGDTIRVTVTAQGTSGGTALVENLSTGVAWEATISGQTDQLCLQNVEWIVEDFSSGGLVPFANFGTVHFTDASTQRVDGTGWGASSAGTIAIVQNGNVITDTTFSGSNDVIVTYTGP